MSNFFCGVALEGDFVKDCVLNLKVRVATRSTGNAAESLVELPEELESVVVVMVVVLPLLPLADDVELPPKTAPPATAAASPVTVLEAK